MVITPQAVFDELSHQFNIVKDEKSSPDCLILRSNLTSNLEAHHFLNVYCKFTSTKFNVYNEINNPKRLVYHKSWICQHSDSRKSPTSKKNAKCKAAIDILIKKVNRGTIKNDPFLKFSPPLPCVIKIKTVHTHNINTADSLRMLPVDKEDKAENVSKYQLNLDIVTQEPPDNITDEPLPSPENIPASQLSNGIVYSQNLNDTTALGDAFNQWIVPNNPDGISSSAAFTDISKSSSKLYSCTNTSEPSCKSLKLFMNSSPNSSEIKDVFSIFGEFVATKIRSFTEQNLQVEAQNCIMNMLFEMEMKLLTKVNMPVINNIPSLKTTSSKTATLPSNIVLISSNPRNSVAFNAMLKTDIQ